MRPGPVCIGGVAAPRKVDYDRLMSARAAFVLGLFLVASALVHGGIYLAGRDFVVNRFTGHYEFVPADDYDEGDDAHHVRGRLHTLTSGGAAARVESLQCRR